MSIRQNEEPELYQSNNLATDKAVQDTNNMSAVSSEAEETLDEIRVSVNQTISRHASQMAMRKETRSQIETKKMFQKVKEVNSNHQ